MRLALIGLLARVGLILGRRGPWARLRGFALMTATCLLVVGLGALVLAGAYAQQRQDRAASIRPRLASAGQQAKLLISFDGFTSLHDRPLSVFSIWPLSPQAPLPPGVRAWPAPGQAVISPAVAEDLGNAGAQNLFGPVAGIIDVKGLDVPRERRVYLRPSTAAFEPQQMERAIGFNGGENGGSADGEGSAYAARLFDVQQLVLIALVAPALVALSLAAGLDGEARIRRTRLLTVLGAGRGYRAWLDAFEAWPAIAAGTVLGAAAVAYLSFHDVTLRGLDAELLASDARSASARLLIAVAAGHLLALATVLLVRRRRTGRGDGAGFRPRPLWQWARAAICVVATAATVWLPAQIASVTIKTVVYTGGLLLVAVTLPAVLGLVFSVLGLIVAGWGMRRGSVGSILGGRRLQMFPVRTARVALGVCFAVLVIGQVQFWSSTFGVEYHFVIKARARMGDIVATAENTTYGPGVKKFLSTLGPGVGAVWVSTSDSTAEQGSASVVTSLRTTTVVRGSCSALAPSGSTCTSGATIPNTSLSPALRQLVQQWQVIGQVKLVAEDRPDFKRLSREQAQLTLVSTTAEPLPLNRLQHDAYELTPGGLQLETIGQSWVTAGTNLKVQGHWIVLLGIFGLAVIVIGTGCVMAGDVIASVRETTPLAVLTHRRGWIFVLAGWRIALPLFTAGTAGAIAYLVLPLGLIGDSGQRTSPPLALACALTSGLFGAAIAFWAAGDILRHSQTWRPGQ